MKPPDEIRREIVAQWLARADEDLSVARHLLALDADDAKSAVECAAEVRDAVTSRLEASHS